LVTVVALHTRSCGPGMRIDLIRVLSRCLMFPPCRVVDPFGIPQRPTWYALGLQTMVEMRDHAGGITHPYFGSLGSPVWGRHHGINSPKGTSSESTWLDRRYPISLPQQNLEFVLIFPGKEGCAARPSWFCSAFGRRKRIRLTTRAHVLVS
jgi:hypothetical protein